MAASLDINVRTVEVHHFNTKHRLTVWNVAKLLHQSLQI
ncbi:MAG: hypothetical protein FJ244_05205 [Nitrospira sp.]|nr:hypothetical protein [Nitrospira sp.]